MKSWLQECLICHSKILWENGDEDIIRATCLPCGHQGLFNLKELSKKECANLVKENKKSIFLKEKI